MARKIVGGGKNSMTTVSSRGTNCYIKVDGKWKNVKQFMSGTAKKPRKKK